MKISATGSLGRSSAIPTTYSPHLLEAVPRIVGRETLIGESPWPHFGEDVWTLYELDALGPDGRPFVAQAELFVPCASPCIIESKSLKLYLFSLNFLRFASLEQFAELICADLSRVIGAPVVLRFREGEQLEVARPEGVCIDAEPFCARNLDDAAGLLRAVGPKVVQTLHSQLLRSLCPVTAQPDWATLVVRYTGPEIQKNSLLDYVVAFRTHQGFHEQCVERIFLDLLRACRCEELTVFARYTRRGGIDINPLRSTRDAWPPMTRTPRQ